MYLATLDDLKLSPIKYDKECKYMCDLDDQDNEQIKQNINDFVVIIFSLNRIISLAGRQAFAHCCELPQV